MFYRITIYNFKIPRFLFVFFNYFRVQPIFIDKSNIYVIIIIYNFVYCTLKILVIRRKNIDMVNKIKTENIAKFIRIATVPPFMVAYLLIALNSITNFFEKKLDIIVSWVGLVILPLLAYLIHRIVPALYSKGRECQRNLAFVFSLIGYLLCFIYGIVRRKSKTQMFLFTYFFAVLFLTIINKLISVRASGHALSSISPAIFSFIYVNFMFGLIFLILFFISVWASLYIKRHKVGDIVSGVICFFLSLIMSFWTQI